MSLFTEANPPGVDHPYPWVEEIKLAMWKGFWTSRKFTFDADVGNFRRDMTPGMQDLTVRSLASIAQVENKVKKYWAFLGLHIADDTIVGGGIVMAGVEEIHHDAYKRLPHKLGLRSEIDAVMNVPEIANRVGYLTKHTLPVYGDNQMKQTLYSLILFTGFVEYVSLFVPFANILHLYSEYNVLKDTQNQVKYTRNEETLHSLFGIGVINECRKEHPELFDKDLESRVYEEAKVAYEAEARLIDWMFENYSHPDHNADVMKNYIRERFNEYLELIGFTPIFEVDPDLAQKTFWTKVGVYASPKVDFFNTEPTGYSQGDASEDDDF
jgi:ribonucleoside-diphosphate reductase beta chain